MSADRVEHPMTPGYVTGLAKAHLEYHAAAMLRIIFRLKTELGARYPMLDLLERWLLAFPIEVRSVEDEVLRRWPDQEPDLTDGITSAVPILAELCRQTRLMPRHRPEPGEEVPR
jgi:hypothetical protein